MLVSQPIDGPLSGRAARLRRCCTDFRMTDAQWENLSIPIGLAFLFHSTRAGGVVAVYPSPAGGTESTPMSDAWEDLVRQNPVLRRIPARRRGAAGLPHRRGARTFRVPIDECYKLVGVVRSKWRGFTGGVELWDEMSRFFDPSNPGAGQ